jgi:hypothetical protein
MPGVLDTEMHGFEEVRKKLKDPRLMGRPITKMFQRAGEEIAGQARKRAPRGADSRLANSIAAEVQRRKPFPLFVRVGPTVKYGVFVEKGTRPHFPPPSALVRWARLKLGAADPERAAFLIARKIARVGTKAQPYMAPGLENSVHRIGRFITMAAIEMRRAWGKA